MSETPTQPYTLQAYIPHQDRPRDHGFSLPLPTTPEVARVFLDNYRITDIHNITIGEVYSLNDEDNNLSYWLNKALDNMGGPNSLDELNYLAIKIQGMDEEQREIFSAALQAKWQVETIPQIINLADNLQCFDLQPAATDADIFGRVMLDWAEEDTAELFEQLEKSENPEEQRFAKYIRHLELSVSPGAYGKLIAKEEGGEFTDYGYLQQYRNLEPKYHCVGDIPAEYSLNPTRQKPVAVLEIPCQNGTLRIGDLVLAAPHLGPRTTDVDSTASYKEVFSGMVGTVTELVTKTAPGKGDTYEVIIDFTTPAYSDKRLMELDSQLGAYYGRPTKPGVWPPIDVDCAEMPPSSLLRITDIPPESLRLVLDSEKMATHYYNATLGIEEKAPVKVKPSLIETLKRNRQRSHETFGNPQFPTDPNKDKGDPSL